MNDFEQSLTEELARLKAAGILRALRRVDAPQSPRIQIGGRPLLNFSSNDYLGLANEPALKEAATRAVDEFGAGAGSARLICGSLAPHHQLEESLAAFKRTPAALSFSSGYATALGAIGALLDSNDVIVIDKLVHACIVDAARLSRARLRVFKHNDLNQLESLLQWAARQTRLATAGARGGRPRILVVTESVFSMDGDRAPVREIVELKERYGAWLMLDEAHATGVFGPQGRGWADAQGVAGQVEIQMGTMGKALGAAGGYIAGSRALVDLLVNRARSFIFSTAPPPATAAAAAAGVAFVQSDAGDQRREQLWSNVARLIGQLPAGPWEPPRTPSAILPLVVGAEERALAMAARLLDNGILLPAIRYPTVARGAARLRLTVSAAHTGADLDGLVAALAAAAAAAPPPPASS